MPENLLLVQFSCNLQSQRLYYLRFSKMPQPSHDREDDYGDDEWKSPNYIPWNQRKSADHDTSAPPSVPPFTIPDQWGTTPQFVKRPNTIVDEIAGLRGLSPARLEQHRLTRLTPPLGEYRRRDRLGVIVPHPPVIHCLPGALVHQSLGTQIQINPVQRRIIPSTIMSCRHAQLVQALRQGEILQATNTSTVLSGPPPNRLDNGPDEPKTS